MKLFPFRSPVASSENLMNTINIGHRRHFSLAASLVAIAFLALGLALVRHFMPLTEDDAIRIATRRFQQLPGAVVWKSYTRRAVGLTGGVCVDFVDPVTGATFTQIVVDKNGSAGEAHVAVPGQPGRFRPLSPAHPAIPPPGEAKGIF